MNKTIIALSSPPGVGGVAVIRISGENSRGVLQRLAGGGFDEPRRLYLKRVAGAGGVSDNCLCAFFAAPHSFTGEDAAEIYCHGSTAVVRAIIAAGVAAGAVPAEAGEFTRRAFLNGKIDLSAAEGIIDLINAQAAAQARAAAAQADGALFKRISAAERELTALLAELEAAIDYPEEDLEETSAAQAAVRVRGILRELEGLTGGYAVSRLVREGVKVALIGAPNAGKSSLLNALLREERAIVSEEKGTTRDTLSESLEYNGYKLVLTDTAGLRETDGTIEKLGVDRAVKAAEGADIILHLSEDGDFSAPLPGLERLINGGNVLRVLTKRDLYGKEGKNAAAEAKESAGAGGRGVIKISAKTGAGLTELLDAITERAGLGGAQDSILYSERHYAAARAAEAALKSFLAAARRGAETELLATDLKTALNALGKITGTAADEEILHQIFSRFCVGK